MDGERASSGDRRPTAPTLALVADLLFASRVRAAANAAGVPATTVHSAEQLLREARATAPRLILLDLDVRGADVPSLIRTLKSDPTTAAIPVVAFGSHVRGEALAAARAAGADRVLARSAFVRDLPALLGEPGVDGPGSRRRTPGRAGDAVRAQGDGHEDHAD